MENHQTMENKISTSDQRKQLVLGFFLLFTVAIVLLAAFKYLDKNVIAALLGLSGTVFTISLQYRNTKKKEIDARHFSEKQKAYTELLDLIISLFKGEKGLSETTSQDELTVKMLDLKSKLLVWASYETLLAFDKIGDVAADQKNPYEILYTVGNLIKSMRKDLGHNDPAQSAKHFALTFLNAEARLEFENSTPTEN